MNEQNISLPTQGSPGLIQRLKGLWRHRTLLGKIGLFLGAAFLVLQGVERACVRLGIISGEPGGNPALAFWVFLKDIGVVGGLSAFCWDSLKARLQEKTEEKPAAPGDLPTPAARGSPARGIVFPFEDPGEFVGLNFQQWFVTLTILFLTVLLGGVLGAFLSGGRSVWVTLLALAVIGGVLAWMSEVARRRSTFKSRMGLVVGASPVALLALSVLCLLPVGVMGGPGGKWVLLIYGLAVFLPAYHLFELVAPGTPRFKHSAGTWIAFSYLSLVVLLGAALHLTTSTPEKAVAQEEDTSRFIGKWVSEDKDDSAHFTKDGMVVVELNGKQIEPMKYRFARPNMVHLQEPEGSHKFGSALLTSDDEMMLMWSQRTFDTPTIKKLVRASRAKSGSPDQKTEDRTRLVGKWVEPTGAGDAGLGPFNKPTPNMKAEFTRDGLAVIEMAGKTWPPMKYQMNGPTRAVIKASYEPGSVAITSDDEIMLTWLGNTARLVRAGSKQAQPKEEAPAVSPQTADRLTAKLVGEWSRVEPAQHPRGNFKYTKQTVFFSKAGTIRYEGRMTLWTGKESQDEQAGKFEVVGENKIKVVGRSTTIIEFDFVSDDEFVATGPRSNPLAVSDGSNSFRYVSGKFRRVK